MRKIQGMDTERAAFALGANRLESPAMVGFKTGMTSTSVIGSKLRTVYGVPMDPPGTIVDMLRVVDDKLGQE